MGTPRDMNEWTSGSVIGAPQGEPAVDFERLDEFLGWEVTPCSLNIIWSCLIRLFSYPGKTGFVAQRLYESPSLIYRDSGTEWVTEVGTYGTKS